MAQSCTEVAKLIVVLPDGDCVRISSLDYILSLKADGIRCTEIVKGTIAYLDITVAGKENPVDLGR